MRRYSPFEIMVARTKQAFPKNRIDSDEKILATLLYHLRLSYGRLSDAYEKEFYYESARKWYKKVGAALPIPQRIRRHVIAVDETKLKIQGKHVFVWSAMDVERFEVLGVKATGGRTELDAIFSLKDVLKFCIGRPPILVDQGLWYLQHSNIWGYDTSKLHSKRGT